MSGLNKPYRAIGGALEADARSAACRRSHAGWRHASPRALIKSPMRSANLDTLFIAGLNGSGPDHWQTRWRRRMPNARLVEQADWDRPDRAAWVGAIVAACEAVERPILLLAHSLGVIALAHAAPLLPAERIKGAF